MPLGLRIMIAISTANTIASEKVDEMYPMVKDSASPMASPPTTAPGRLPIPPITAAVIGGIGNLPGAVVGGLTIGLAQSLTIGFVSSTFSDAIVFVLLIAVMILRPSGLFGRPALQKV